MSVRRKVPISDETFDKLADATGLPVEYLRANNPPTYTEVQRVVIDASGAPQVKTTTCCCSSPGALRRICARTRNLKNPCRCSCHSHETDADWRARRAKRALAVEPRRDVESDGRRAPRGGA